MSCRLTLVTAPAEVLEFLQAPHSFLPELERLLTGGAQRAKARFDRIGHFIPRELGGDNTSHPIFVAGRSFAGYESTRMRRKWHQLTQSIADHKDSVEFAEEWVAMVRTFLLRFITFRTRDVVVTVVPHRPGRTPRLENFLAQLEASLEERPIRMLNVAVHPTLLAYKDGVRSNHGDHLSSLERFANVRDHLVVNDPEVASSGAAVLVIDDVTTTGASLIYAAKYLEDAGAGDVRCLSMAKNVGDLY